MSTDNMSTDKNPDSSARSDTISCKLCHKEVPLSEAYSVEGEDYVLHFCGIHCFDAWEKKAEQKFSTNKPDPNR